MAIWQGRRTAVEAVTEMMSSPQARQGIESFHGGKPPSRPVWRESIPLGDTRHGFEKDSGAPRLMETGSVNFRIPGYFLFICGCHRDGFVADINGLRGSIFDIFGLADHRTGYSLCCFGSKMKE